MTLGHFFNHMGMGPKQLTDRFTQTEYGAGVQDGHLFYDQEPPHNLHQFAAPKHHHHHGGGGGGGHKSNAAMSALTLLAFLFFLHILQQCLKEHMTAMSTPQVVVMTGGREGDEHIAKTVAMDTDTPSETRDTQPEIKLEDSNSKFENGKENAFTKIRTSEHRPHVGSGKYKNVIGNRNAFPGFVSAMND